MVATMISEQRWNVLQGPSRPSHLPGSYLLLLSALDQGWKVSRVSLQPSWDQHGFVYVLTLKRFGGCRVQQLVLPRTSQVEALLSEYASRSSSGHR